MPDSGTARAAALVGRDGTRCDGANPVSNTGQDRTPQSAHHPVMRAAEVTQDWRQVAWKRDVVLEVWVDVQRSPISIRLSGTLDRGTATNLAALVEELIAEGGHEFKLETPALHLCDSGVAALAEVQRLIERSGGRLTWDGSTMSRPAFVWDHVLRHVSSEGSMGARPHVERVG